MKTVDHPYRESAAVSPILDVTRIAVGGILLFMGIRFGGHPRDVLAMVADLNGFMSLFVVHYIVMSHIVGGIMLIIGLLSRIAAIVQLPILVGAIVLAFAGDGYGSIYTNAWFPIAVLVMLLIVSYYGSGRLSLDSAMREKKRSA